MHEAFDVTATVREIRQLVYRSGWEARTDRSRHTTSVYLRVFRGYRQFTVRVSDHPPGRRHIRRRMICIHPGGHCRSDVEEAIRCGNIDHITPIATFAARTA